MEPDEAAGRSCSRLRARARARPRARFETCVLVTNVIHRIVKVVMGSAACPTPDKTFEHEDEKNRRLLLIRDASRQHQ
jgi:hypothetical protein